MSVTSYFLKKPLVMLPAETSVGPGLADHEAVAMGSEQNQLTGVKFLSNDLTSDILHQSNSPILLCIWKITNSLLC